jgi:nucleotide-binding universal stress UspA family protein
MYKKILVPLDGSELAECALTHVKNLVKDGTGGEVILLNVVNMDFTSAWNTESEINDIINNNAIRKDLLIKSRKYLENVESRLGSEGIKIKIESLEGSRPADTISEYAQKKGVDMIIIATHGYTGLKKLRFGSVALGVIHESHIPVLLIRPESCRM